MRLTRRGVVVLVLSVLLLGAGWWGGYPFGRALGAIGLAAVVAALLLTARGLTADVTRTVYPDRVERGRTALVTLKVRNRSGRRRGGFLAADPAAGAVRTVRVQPLRAGAEATYHYELPTSVRGRVVVGPLTLHRVDPFGLADNRLRSGSTAVLRVHPRRHAARVLSGGYPRHHHEGGAADRILRGSVDLRDVREYVPGDEVRHLHWKATARTGRLMVRELTDPPQPRLTVLLDTRPQTLAPQRFEEAVDAAASLLVAAARAGQHTRLVTPSGLDVAVPGGAPASRRMLDELCDVRQGGSVLQVPGSRGLVVVTGTPLPSDDLSSALVVMSFTEGPAPVVPGVRVIAAATAALAVIRWNGMSA
ncbi:hypothetical protein Val02_53150 [Virgisporangium aliadipatigenens]|uniref:DUF58 domain-containing protein n=1 Tax=Virgisporangium aliadipatigenens TaxID=741659 RepID=A0A8J4DS81_9ACTN|nr:DUF58 domain-containing protein [Virgisporangium aliadipatigenens]GIJ48429.1 hypothetical protein Val02_53150 [Virgisporangium aliadipatigenens]